MVQLLGFACGLLVVHMLPVEQYGFYTLANTAVATMLALADGGIASGVMSQGGKVWKDRQLLGQVVATGLKLRHQFAVITLSLSLPALFTLLTGRGATTFTALLVTAATIPTFTAMLSGRLFTIAPKLHQDIRTIQITEILSGLLRLIALAGVLFLSRTAAAALVAAGASQIWWNRKLKKVSAIHASPTESPREDTRHEILKIVKRVMPSTIYFSISLQLGLWILSIFGTTESIARFGAINRITTAATVVVAVFSYLVAPRFARLPESRTVLRGHFLKIQALLTVVCTSGYMIAFFAAQYILWLLPEHYHNLTTEFRLQTATATIGILIAGLLALNSSRGFFMNPIIHIPLNIAIVATTAFIFQPSDLIGVLKMELTRAAVGPFIQNAIFFISIGKTKA